MNWRLAPSLISILILSSCLTAPSVPTRVGRSIIPSEEQILYNAWIAWTWLPHCQGVHGPAANSQLVLTDKRIYLIEGVKQSGGLTQAQINRSMDYADAPTARLEGWCLAIETPGGTSSLSLRIYGRGYGQERKVMNLIQKQVDKASR